MLKWQIHPFRLILSSISYMDSPGTFRFCRGGAQEKAAAALGTALCADLARALEKDTVQAIEVRLGRKQVTGAILNEVT